MAAQGQAARIRTEPFAEIEFHFDRSTGGVGEGFLPGFGQARRAEQGHGQGHGEEEDEPVGHGRVEKQAACHRGGALGSGVRRLEAAATPEVD
ncbi:MAG: hypothetical protein GY937_26870 [bacterium]|nr:hypothetical protein [bacterium]